ncbi:MAG: pyridoxal-phosphate dependent enzyme [Collinsella sp.]
MEVHHSKVCVHRSAYRPHPLLELTHFEADEDLRARVLVKLEYFNPAGSVKDRVAKSMIDEAEKAGKLCAVATTPSSAHERQHRRRHRLSGGRRSYEVIITMPGPCPSAPQTDAAYGAQLVLTDGSKGMKGAIAKAEELQKETPNSNVAHASS